MCVCVCVCVCCVCLFVFCHVLEMAHSLCLLFFVLVYKDLRSVHMTEKRKKGRLIIMIKIIIIHVIVFLGRIST